MKIAGLKNDGAWFRFNKWLKGISLESKLSLTEDASLIVAYGALFDVLADVQAHSGGGSLIFPTTGVGTGAEILSNHLNTGIPRTVYMGHLAWDVYSRVEPGSAFPNQFYASKGSSGDWIMTPKSSLTTGHVERTNTKAVAVYAARNTERMNCIGVIVRDRLKAIKLTRRLGLDFANLAPANQGNPGGIADANIET